jgi:hypothetical protein
VQPAPAETSPAETSPSEAVGTPSPAPDTAAEAVPRPEDASEASTPATQETPAASAALPPRLDIAALETKLRDTDAIGFFTKLELKSQVDTLLDRFRGYHQNGRPPLAELRERFNLLFLKVLTLLQNDAPTLHAEIAGARDGLWSMLADPKEFQRL